MRFFLYFLINLHLSFVSSAIEYEEIILNKTETLNFTGKFIISAQSDTNFGIKFQGDKQNIFKNETLFIATKP